MATRGNSKVAARYARAVLDSLLQGGKGADLVRKVGTELEEFGTMVEANRELNLVLDTHVFSAHERGGIIEDLVKAMNFTSETRRTLLVISDAGRIRYVKGIAEKLHLLLLESAQVVPLRVLTSADLSADEQNKIETKFSKLFGKQVEASYVVEPSLIGGLRVTAAGRTYDGSLSGWLDIFEERLVGGSI